MGIRSSPNSAHPPDRAGVRAFGDDLAAEAEAGVRGNEGQAGLRSGWGAAHTPTRFIRRLASASSRYGMNLQQKPRRGVEGKRGQGVFGAGGAGALPPRSLYRR